LCGTSASGPSFAGVVALLTQYLMKSGATSQPGLGNVNPQLYRMAQTTPIAFHDITIGSNAVPCQIGTLDCTNGTEGYAAGPGYDRATGLGSLDVFNFVTNWSISGGTAISASANAQKIPVNAAAVISIAVSSSSGGGTPSGTVALNIGDQIVGSATLANASATITIYGTQLAAGTNTIAAAYSGDSNFNASSTTFSLTVTAAANASVVTPSVSPNPAYQSTPDENGNNFQFGITLTESAGVATTLTGFTID